MTTTWKMTSSSGRERATFRLLPPRSSWRRLMRVSLVGMFWPRGVPLVQDTLGPVFHAVLPQVVVDLAKLEKLWRQISRWMEQPFEFECDLGGGADNVLTSSLGIDPELICSVDRPVCTVSYHQGALLLMWKAVVDQTCVRIFSDGLAQALMK
jgi:hypothetical protein